MNLSDTDKLQVVTMMQAIVDMKAIEADGWLIITNPPSNPPAVIWSRFFARPADGGSRDLLRVSCQELDADTVAVVIGGTNERDVGAKARRFVADEYQDALRPHGTDNRFTSWCFFLKLYGEASAKSVGAS